MALKTVSIADKQTLDAVKDLLGTTGDTGGSSTEGTTMAKLNSLLNSLQSFSAVAKIGEEILSPKILPSTTSRVVSVVYKDEIHLFINNYHYKWDGSSWTSVSTIPSTNTVYACAVIYDDEIHLLGVGDGTYHYKWDGTSWTSVSTIPFAFTYGQCLVYNNEIHILGGSSYPTYHYKWDGSSWTSVSTLPYSFSYGSSAVYNDEIHILGSDNSSYYTKHYKWNGTSWTSVSTLSTGNQRGKAIIFDGLLHLLFSTYHFTWNGSYWTNVGTIPFSVSGSNAHVLAEGIHLLDGGSRTHLRYEFNVNGWTTSIKKYYLLAGMKIYAALDSVVAYGNVSETEYGYEVISDGAVVILGSKFVIK